MSPLQVLCLIGYVGGVIPALFFATRFAIRAERTPKELLFTKVAFWVSVISAIGLFCTISPPPGFFGK